MSDICTETGRVVVGVDGSPASDRAVLWAAEQARLEARGLTLVHAIDPEPLLLSRATETVRANVVRAVHETSRTLLARDVDLATRAAPDVQVTARFCDADPREALIAISEFARMVVLGARGRGPVASLVLGSVSTAVARHAQCPTVVVRPTEETKVPAERILASVAGTHDLAVLDLAFELAASRRQPLTVLHTTWDPGAAQFGWVALDEESVLGWEGRREVRHEIEQYRHKYPTVEVDVEVVAGRASDAVLDRALDGATIVVARHRGGSFSATSHGWSETAVLERAHGVVVVVPGAAR